MEGLLNQFQDYGWAPHNYANTSPVQTPPYSIQVSATNWQALWIYHDTFTTPNYTNLSFWINGGAGGGQIIQLQGVQLQSSGGVGLGTYTIPTLPANTWVSYSIPLSTLGVGGSVNYNGFWWQLTAYGTTNPFYLDTIQLLPTPPPAPTPININPAQIVRMADARWFGINTAVWDNYFDTPTTVSELTNAGLQFLRFPGGSLSDDYHWAKNVTDSNTWMWATSFTNFAHVATNIGAQAIITVNYGSGTPAEAAAWVTNANASNHWGFKYWEIGNELYGTWETDSNTYPHDPYTYATRAKAYITQMKAADPTIKIGVVVTTGEDSDSNGYTNHSATNLAGEVHYGWTPVLLSTLKSLGVTPDFAIYHWYPQFGTDSDFFLLQGTSNWIGDAANLRFMISNYFGTGGTNIELLCTENNSDSGPPGKQSVSLVNGLYYADSFCQLMQTEFNSYIWWDLRNGTETDGDLDSSLYGWREYGDLGVMNGLGTSLTNRYPEYFTAKIMQYFIRGGDKVLAPATNNSYLPAYAARRADGTLTVLVINKDPANTYNVQINLNGFTPNTTATVYSYGMPQDNAAAAGNPACDISRTNLPASTNFTYSFSPYSVTVFAFPPVGPVVSIPPQTSSSTQLILQLAGQSGTPYVLQTSSNLLTWSSVSTNLLTNNAIALTNTLATNKTAQYWRAAWLP